MLAWMGSAKRSQRGILLAWALCCFLIFFHATARAAESRADSDHDGLSDGLEQDLLLQFLPTFMIASQDCSRLPAEFRAGVEDPEIKAENGTIYGQAFPAKSSTSGSPEVELHYYDLWRKDCGRHGHPLDTEHVAVLIRASSADLGSAHWKALFWYAAAHENTVCDVSQIARASALDAEDDGPTVWISPGKHASYLSSKLCGGGCGADRCAKMTKLAPVKVVNLGEPEFPMNGSLFIASTAWPLQHKMSTSDFPPEAITRLISSPDTTIASFNPGRHPVQGIIATSSDTEQAVATSGASATAAMSLAADTSGDALAGTSDSTGAALANASRDTGGALHKTYRHTRQALGTSIRHVGKAVHLTRRQDEDPPR